VSIDIEGPYGSEVVIDILRASGWTSRIHWPNHRSPKMYQAHPSALAPMIATTAITIDKIASLRMAMPSLQAKIKHQRRGFSDFFEVGVGEHRLEIGVKRRPARPLAFSRHPCCFR
jgi:hypothetical protein